ncbi:hypothetical protein MPER_12008 [Moniliophthora perniciosa FA553]|nr:hypothetical protein MPER_12008 [Moniliophthora perniciosa FA553]
MFTGISGSMVDRPDFFTFSEFSSNVISLFGFSKLVPVQWFVDVGNLYSIGSSMSFNGKVLNYYRGSLALSTRVLVLWFLRE